MEFPLILVVGLVKEPFLPASAKLVLLVFAQNALRYSPLPAKDDKLDFLLEEHRNRSYVIYSLQKQHQQSRRSGKQKTVSNIQSVTGCEAQSSRPLSLAACCVTETLVFLHVKDRYFYWCAEPVSAAAVGNVQLSSCFTHTATQKEKHFTAGNKRLKGTKKRINGRKENFHA